MNKMIAVVALGGLGAYMFYRSKGTVKQSQRDTSARISGPDQSSPEDARLRRSTPVGSEQNSVTQDNHGAAVPNYTPPLESDFGYVPNFSGSEEDMHNMGLQFTPDPTTIDAEQSSQYPDGSLKPWEVLGAQRDITINY